MNHANSNEAAQVQLFGINDLAERWSVSVNTIYKWRTQGIGPKGIKLGRHIRFRLADVEAFEDSQLEAPLIKK